MSGQQYIDGDTRRENDEAKRQGVPVPRIAELRHMEVSELCSLMGWPQWKEIPTDNVVAEPVVDLWRVPEAEAQL